jgi:hypothetical protein
MTNGSAQLMFRSSRLLQIAARFLFQEIPDRYPGRGVNRQPQAETASIEAASLHQVDRRTLR